MTASPLIEIEGLRVTFHGDDGRATHAVDRVDLSVANGATLGLVGESGCGKTTLANAILGILSENARCEAGTIRFRGEDLLRMPRRQVEDEIRGRSITFSVPPRSCDCWCNRWSCSIICRREAFSPSDRI